MSAADYSVPQIYSEISLWAQVARHIHEQKHEQLEEDLFSDLSWGDRRNGLYYGLRGLLNFWGSPAWTKECYHMPGPPFSNSILWCRMTLMSIPALVHLTCMVDMWLLRWMYVNSSLRVICYTNKRWWWHCLAGKVKWGWSGHWVNITKCPVWTSHSLYKWMRGKLWWLWREPVSEAVPPLEGIMEVNATSITLPMHPN